MSEFAAHYRHLRYLAGDLSQAQFAALIGCSRAHVQRCEAGADSYTHPELIAISQVLEIPLAMVMEHDETQPGAQLPEWFRGYFRLRPGARKVFDTLAGAALALAALGRRSE